MATTSEMNTEAVAASAMSRKSCPDSSRMVITGRKTATLVSVLARMAPQTSLAPR
jgi:hypothetical protein